MANRLTVLLTLLASLALACSRSGTESEPTGRAENSDGQCKTDGKPHAYWTKPADVILAATCVEIWVDWGEKTPDGTIVEGARNMWCCAADGGKSAPK